MAIIIRGKTKCVLCGKVLEEEQDAVSFSPFVSNELDPLYKFSDAAFHERCFREDALAEKALKRYEELRSHVGPGTRTCVVCQREITDPDDYFAVGHLTDNPADALYRFNYTQAHQSHLPQWVDLPRLLKLLTDLKQSGTLRGQALDRLISKLEEARSGAV